jgi:hypothetical protein
MVAPNARSSSVPAPVGGLNDRDSLADMPEKDAVLMVNWWPYPSYVGVRRGSNNHVTGFPAAVETLAEYLPATGTAKLFAVSGGSIYDATTSGAVGSAVVTGLSNSRFQTQSITTPGGSFLYFVNGVDSPRLWDGSAWTTITGVSTPAITGVTTSTLVHVTLFKNRLFFVQNNSMNLWYLPVNSIGGAANVLDLGSIFRKGGSIQAVYTWTLDAGDGADDHLVVISTNGEVAVYQGTDPSSAATWGIIGVFVLGRPLGRRCGTKFAGDLAINTTEGVQSLSRGLLSASIDKRATLTDKIQNSVSLSAELYETNFGWQVELFPDANMLILNIPQGAGSNFQFVQNTITGAWSKFEGWNANCWLNASSGLFYGGSNSVVQAWVSATDLGAGINADLVPAFSNFGRPARNKYFTLVRANLLTNGFPSASYGLCINYAIQETESALDFNPYPGMIWGSMVWGSMIWGGALVSVSNWETVGDVAESASLRLQVLNNGADVRLTSIDYLNQLGGIL